MRRYGMCGCGSGRGCGCGCGAYEDARGFLTKEERIEVLSEYKKSLEQEVKGIEESIQELKKKSN